MTSRLLQLAAILLALLVIVGHLQACTSISTRLRVFDRMVYGVDLDLAFSLALCSSLTAVQLLLPLNLLQPTGYALTRRLAGLVLVILLSICGAQLTLGEIVGVRPLASADALRAAGLWLTVELTATILQGLVWHRPTQLWTRGIHPANQAGSLPARGQYPLRSFESRLMTHLQAAAAGESGGELIVTQAALAAACGCSASTINSALHALSASGAIGLSTTARQTRIRIIERVPQGLPTANSGGDNTGAQRSTAGDLDSTASVRLGNGPVEKSTGQSRIECSNYCSPATLRTYGARLFGHHSTILSLIADVLADVRSLERRLLGSRSNDFWSRARSPVVRCHSIDWQNHCRPLSPLAPLVALADLAAYPVCWSHHRRAPR